MNLVCVQFIACAIVADFGCEIIYYVIYYIIVNWKRSANLEEIGYAIVCYWPGLEFQVVGCMLELEFGTFNKFDSAQFVAVLAFSLARFLLRIYFNN